jgi:hypothetical protein
LGVLQGFVNRWVKELEKWAVRPSAASAKPAQHRQLLATSVQAVRPLAASVMFVRVVASEILCQNLSQFKKAKHVLQTNIVSAGFFSLACHALSCVHQPNESLQRTLLASASLRLFISGRR